MGEAAEVCLLDKDPDLGAGLDREQFQVARRLTGTTVLKQERGDWAQPEPMARDVLGLLVLGGVAGARIEVEGRRGLELVGTGDILRPWVGLEPDDEWPLATRWSVFSRLEMAIIDTRLAPVMTRWPALLNAFVQRQTLRQRRLLFQLAVLSMNSVENRLLYELWHLADRWGRMTSEGAVLDLPISHNDLADLVGARRPTVTTSLVALRDANAVVRGAARGRWILKGGPPPDLDRLHAEAALEPVRLLG